MKPRLKLTVRAIRSLQEKHGIANLLQATADDVAKMATLDFLVDFYFEGSLKWEAPPSKDDIEDLDIAELSAAVQSAIAGEPAAGNV